MTTKDKIFLACTLALISILVITIAIYFHYSAMAQMSTNSDSSNGYNDGVIQATTQSHDTAILQCFNASATKLSQQLSNQAAMASIGIKTSNGFNSTHLFRDAIIQALKECLP